MRTQPRRHIAWSTDKVDPADPFQRKWYLRQVLLHGRAEDIRTLDMEEIAGLLDELDLPTDIYQLWKTFLEWRAHASG